MSLKMSIEWKTIIWPDATFVIRDASITKIAGEDNFTVSLIVDSYVDSSLSVALLPDPVMRTYHGLKENDLKWNKFYNELKNEPYFDGAVEV